MSRGRKKNYRSRRCLLLAGLIFLAVQLGVGLVLDRSLPKIRFYHGEMVMGAAARLSRCPDIMFLGSSRFGGGLNMRELQELMSKSFGADAPLMFNAAVPAGDPFTMDHVVRLLAGQGITPGMAIIEVNPETVKPWCPWIGFEVIRLITWQDMPDLLPDLIAARRVSFLLSSRIIPVFLYRKELLNWIFDSPPPYLKAAGAAAAAPGQPAVPRNHEDSTPEPAEGSVNPQPVPQSIARYFRNYRIGGINAQHLESMLSYLHQRNVPVILVGFPACRYYLAACSPEVNRKFMDYIEYLEHAYGCSYVDCRNRVPNKFFLDDVHLCPDGAVLFTRVLESEVLHDVWINFRRSRQTESSGKEGAGK